MTEFEFVYARSEMTEKNWLELNVITSFGLDSRPMHFNKSI